MVEEVVARQGLAGVGDVGAEDEEAGGDGAGEERGEGRRQDLLPRQRPVGAGGPVHLKEAEVDDRAGLVAERLDEDLRVEHAVGDGAQPLPGLLERLLGAYAQRDVARRHDDTGDLLLPVAQRPERDLMDVHFGDGREGEFGSERCAGEGTRVAGIPSLEHLRSVGAAQRRLAMGRGLAAGEPLELPVGLVGEHNAPAAVDDPGGFWQVVDKDLQQGGS